MDAGTISRLSLQEGLRGPISYFRDKNPAIIMDHPNANIALINATLLPYNDGITCMPTLKQEVH